MLVSMDWLKSYFPELTVSPEALADKMSRSGIEVEAVSRMSDGLKKIVVGHVLTCEPHPDSDHLSICQVNVGESEPYQIVCGAPNVAAGENVIVALPGSRIAGNTKIKKSKMRGVVSQGMLCSLEELGFSESVVPKEMADGIYLLPTSAVAGEEIFPILAMDDAIIELSITPNRADALSMNGVAYEVGAIYNQTPLITKPVVSETGSQAADAINVTVTNKEQTPHYQMRMIENVRIAPSPQWIQNRLMNAGIRPINNVVDVTNYILLEYGQPLHAFDYGRLASQEIVVRNAKEHETLVTLDGTERQLRTEDIVITNGQEPVALAGVMGGASTEIFEGTTTVALEAALFDPLAIRKTARHFNLRSESSSRFEKGINQGAITEALDAAAVMITELAGGSIAQGIVTGTAVVPENQVVTITLDRLNGALGTDLTTDEVTAIFQDLGFEQTLEGQTFTVSVPPRRWDITIEADLVEEVARIYGYDALPSTLPAGTIQIGRLTKQQQWLRDARTVLEAHGLNEAISYALTTPEKAAYFVEGHLPQVELQWPMSEDRAVLRTSLVPGLLEDVAYNQKRKATAVPFYEVGKVFVASPAGELPVETTHLAVAISGLTQAASWQEKATTTDYYELKGIVEALLERFQLSAQVTFEATSAYPDFHPGRTALLKDAETGEVYGVVGQVHPTTAKIFDVKETYVAELNVEKLVAATETHVNYQAVSKYPAVQRDIALLVDEQVAHAAIVTVIAAKGGRLLKDIHLFDVYQGANLGTGKKSLAYSLTFEDPNSTLVDEEINRMVEKIQQALTTELNAEIR